MVERVQRAKLPAHRPPKYDPEIMPNAAKFMAQRGAIMCEIADAFKISTKTLYNWINQYPEFREAIQTGVDVFNPRVERALAERAIGFYQTVVEKHVTKDGDIIDVEYEKYFPPDVTAAIFFLKNRMKDKYRDVQDYNVNQKTLKSSAELKLEIRDDILELQADGYLKDVKLPALPTPKTKTNDR